MIITDLSTGKSMQVPGAQEIWKDWFQLGKDWVMDCQCTVITFVKRSDHQV